MDAFGWPSSGLPSTSIQQARDRGDEPADRRRPAPQSAADWRPADAAATDQLHHRHPHSSDEHAERQRLLRLHPPPADQPGQATRFHQPHAGSRLLDLPGYAEVLLQKPAAQASATGFDRPGAGQWPANDGHGSSRRRSRLRSASSGSSGSADAYDEFDSFLGPIRRSELDPLFSVHAKGVPHVWNGSRRKLRLSAGESVLSGRVSGRLQAFSIDKPTDRDDQ